MIKAYGNLYPATQSMVESVRAVLADWYIADAVELHADILRISHEGEYFPEAEVVAALCSFLQPEQKGKLDIIDLENWQLSRHIFEGGTVVEKKASLDKALEPCPHS